MHLLVRIPTNRSAECDCITISFDYLHFDYPVVFSGDTVRNTFHFDDLSVGSMNSKSSQSVLHEVYQPVLAMQWRQAGDMVSFNLNSILRQLQRGSMVRLEVIAQVSKQPR